MRCAVLALALVACTTGVVDVDVVVLSGEQAATGAIVIAHGETGERLGVSRVEADGHVSVRVPPDAFVTVLFPADPTATRLVSVAVEGAGDEIVLHGPAIPAELPHAATMVIAPTTAPIADQFGVLLACTSMRTTTFPISIDVDTSCVGPDGRIPIVVFADRGGVTAEYAAESLRVEDGQAIFAPTDWHPASPNVPVALQGVVPAVDWTLWIDGLPFGPFDVGAGGTVWDGLAVERATIHARVADSTQSQDTTRDMRGAPDSISFVADDFLPPVPLTTSLRGLPGPAQITFGSLSFAWMDPNLEADVSDLYLGWLSRFRGTVTWHVILPVETRQFTTPPFVDELADLTPSGTPAVLLRHIDAADVAGFTEARAGGVWVQDPLGPDTIINPQLFGPVRQSSSYGFESN